MELATAPNIPHRLTVLFSCVYDMVDLSQESLRLSSRDNNVSILPDADPFRCNSDRTGDINRLTTPPPPPALLPRLPNLPAAVCLFAFTPRGSVVAAPLAVPAPRSRPFIPVVSDGNCAPPCSSLCSVPSSPHGVVVQAQKPGSSWKQDYLH